MLKIATGYAIGSTTSSILHLLGLSFPNTAGKSPVLTTRGKFCLWEYFKVGYENAFCEYEGVNSLLADMARLTAKLPAEQQLNFFQIV